jgi:hypothetical protein
MLIRLHLLKRLRNLWALSSYHPHSFQVASAAGPQTKTELHKEISTLKKKPVTIIKPDPIDIFANEEITQPISEDKTHP